MAQPTPPVQHIAVLRQRITFGPDRLDRERAVLRHFFQERGAIEERCNKVLEEQFGSFVRVADMEVRPGSVEIATIISVWSIYGLYDVISKYKDFEDGLERVRERFDAIVDNELTSLGLSGRTLTSEIQPLIQPASAGTPNAPRGRLVIPPVDWSAPPAFGPFVWAHLATYVVLVALFVFLVIRSLL